MVKTRRMLGRLIHESATPTRPLLIVNSTLLAFVILIDSVSYLLCFSQPRLMDFSESARVLMLAIGSIGGFALSIAWLWAGLGLPQMFRR